MVLKRWDGVSRGLQSLIVHDGMVCDFRARRERGMRRGLYQQAVPSVEEVMA